MQIKRFLLELVLFANFEAKQEKTAQKIKNVAHKCVLEIHFELISCLEDSSLSKRSKSLYPTV